MSSLQLEVAQNVRPTEKVQHNSNNDEVFNATNKTPKKRANNATHKSKLSRALEKLTCNFKKQTQKEMYKTSSTHKRSDLKDDQTEHIRATFQEKAEKEYKAELKRINDALLETEEHESKPITEFTNGSLSTESTTISKKSNLMQCFIPPLYLRKRDPAADEARSVLRNAVKAIELHLRFKEIERYDELHAKFYELLTSNNRISVSRAEFVEIVNEMNKWNDERAAKTEKEMEQTSNIVAASIASSCNSNNNNGRSSDNNASSATGQHERAPSQPRSLLNSPSASSQPHHQRQHSRSSCNISVNSNNNHNNNNNTNASNTTHQGKSYNNNNSSNSLVNKTSNTSILSSEPTSCELTVARKVSEHMSQLPGICLLLSSSSSPSPNITSTSTKQEEALLPLNTHESEMQETEFTIVNSDNTSTKDNETNAQKTVIIETENEKTNFRTEKKNNNDVQDMVEEWEKDKTLEQEKLNDEKNSESETWGSSLRDVLYESTITPPCINLEMFMNAPRSLFNNTTVNVSTLYQIFAKGVSLMKCEAELVMWDTNNDGRLSEDEVENYVRDLVPRIAALQNLSEELLPFYCCTVSRRIFWDLDQSNRGMIRIEALLQSTIMEEWVQLQLMTEDSPTNWFGSIVTQHLYEKFLLLDTRNEGTLNVQNLRRYKKGLPTVIDDGLPINVSPLSSLFIDRFFETNVMMANCELDYRKFVDFVIAVEKLPQCSRPLFFWHILDLNHTNILTPLTVNYFFRETHAKLVSAGLAVPPREVVMQEVFDLIPSSQPLCITRDEFIRSSQAGLFVSLIIDCLSFWTYENREQR